MKIYLMVIKKHLMLEFILYYILLYVSMSIKPNKSQQFYELQISHVRLFRIFEYAYFAAHAEM